MPSFEEWENAILGVVDGLVEISNSYPRMEAKIFGQWEGIVHTQLRVFLFFLNFMLYLDGIICLILFNTCALIRFSQIFYLKLLLQ